MSQADTHPSNAAETAERVTVTDCELLEAAAKAEGHTYPWVMPARGGERPWNPLTDDGDALRLAVNLSFTVGEHLGARHAGLPPCPDDYEDGGYPVRIAQVDGADPYAATRRAIVRAAAAMAKP